MYIQENILVNLYSVLHNNGLLLTLINYILKCYLLLINLCYDSKSIVSYSWNAWLLPELLIFYGDRLQPQYWKMLPAFLKLFLMTHVLKSLCLGDKRTTVVRRDVQCITQVYPGKPQALICNSVSALFGPTYMDTDGCVSCSRLLTGPIKTWKTKAFISSMLTTVPTVLLMLHFSLCFPYREYLSPERNQTSFRAYDLSLLF